MGDSSQGMGLAAVLCDIIVLGYRIDLSGLSQCRYHTFDISNFDIVLSDISKRRYRFFRYIEKSILNFRYIISNVFLPSIPFSATSCACADDTGRKVWTRHVRWITGTVTGRSWHV